jgi:hypothetical protein
MLEHSFMIALGVQNFEVPLDIFWQGMNGLYYYSLCKHMYIHLTPSSDPPH